MDLIETYNKIAEGWFKDHHQDDWWVTGVDKFIAFLKPGAYVLDVGCGAGIKSKYLIDKGLKVVGMDFSEKMIEIAKREVPSARFFVMDVNDLSDLKENFDGIFAQAVLLHISKKEIKNVLKILISKLKPLGYLYIAVKEREPGGKEEEIKVEDDYGYKYERFFSYFTLDEVKNYLNDLQIKICYKAIIPQGATRWLQIIGQLK